MSILITENIQKLGEETYKAGLETRDAQSVQKQILGLLGILVASQLRTEALLRSSDIVPITPPVIAKKARRGGKA